MITLKDFMDIYDETFIYVKVDGYDMERHDMLSHDNPLLSRSDVYVTAVREHRSPTGVEIDVAFASDLEK